MKELVSVRQLLMYTVAVAGLGFLIGYILGHDIHVSNVRTRALAIKAKECYTQDDVDYIVFGESQK